VILECAIVVEVVDIVHVKNFFRMKDIEFLAYSRKMPGKFLIIDDILEVIEDIEEFHKDLLVRYDKWVR